MFRYHVPPGNCAVEVFGVLDTVGTADLVFDVVVFLVFLLFFGICLVVFLFLF